MTENIYDDPQYIERYAKKRCRSKTTRHRRRKELQYIRHGLSLLEVEPGATVLDMPSGTGWLSEVLAEDGYDVYPADLSLAMLEVLLKDHSHLADRALCCDILHLPFPDDTFDVAVSIRMFHHFPDGETREKALSELARVSRRGVILSFFHSVSLHALVNRIRGIDHVRFALPLSTLRKEAAAVGLELVKSYCPLKYVKRNWIACFEKR